MKLILLYGPPAVGKLTVGKELSALTGYKLFHNHLVVDTLLSIFPFGSPSFVELRESIWLSVFAEAAKSRIDGLIFTFAPEPTVRPTFIPTLQQTLREHASELLFVELTCPVAHLRDRLNTPSRQAYKKLISHDIFDALHARDAFSTSSMPTPALTIDTAQTTPTEASHLIATSLQLT